MCVCVCVCVSVCVSVCVLCVCSLSVFFPVSVGGPDILLTTGSGRPAPVYLFNVLVHDPCYPSKHLIHGHLAYKSREGCKLYIGEDKYQTKRKRRKEIKKERKKERIVTANGNTNI